MATTSISGEKGVRLASAVAARPAALHSTASDGLERFSIPVEGPAPSAIPVLRGAAEPKAATRDGGAAKTAATASLASPIAQSALPISDLVRSAKAAIPSSLPSTENAPGQIADVAETWLPRARKDEDLATPTSEAGLGGFPWLSEQRTSVVAEPVSESARTAQVLSSQDGHHVLVADRAEAALLPGLPVQRNTPSVAPLPGSSEPQVAVAQPEQGRAFDSTAKGVTAQPTSPRQGGDPSIVSPRGAAAAMPSFLQQPVRQAYATMADSTGTKAVPSNQEETGSSVPSPIRASGLLPMPQQDGKAGMPSSGGAEPSPALFVQTGGQNPLSAVAAGTQLHQAPQPPGPLSRSAGPLPVQARQWQVSDVPSGQASLPIAGNGGLSAPPVQAGSALPSSSLPPSTMVQATATPPVQAIVSEAAETNPVTTAEERSEDVAVPADGMVPNATGMMTLAFAPPESVALPPAANAPAMATQAGAAPPPNTGEIVSHGIGAARAPDGRPAALPALGTDRSASSERETISVKAFDEFASGSAMASGDLASAPATPFGPAPAAPLPAPALDPGGILPQAQAVPVPLGAVAMTIGLRSLAGSNRFEISLDPKDLGRIDVNLDIDKDNGTVTAHLTVDRPETLALLQRDVGNLQQALSQAGFDSGDVGINLSLRSDTGSTGGNGAERDGGGSRDGRSGNGGADLKEQRLSNDAVPLRMLRGLGGLDIRI